jgi:Helix-turn-helix
VVFAGASPTRNGLDDLDLFAVVADDVMADVDDAISAGVGALPVLCVVDPHGQDVFAVLLPDLVVRAVAGLFAVVDRVEASTRAAGHEVKILADVADLVTAGAVELEGPQFAGVAVGTVRWLRYSHGVNLLARLAGLRGILGGLPAGPFILPTILAHCCLRVNSKPLQKCVDLCLIFRICCCTINGMETTTHTTALRRLRQEAKLSLAEVSRRTGIDKSQLSRLESGQTIPTVERLRQLGEVYGVAAWKVLQLMEREEEL